MNIFVTGPEQAIQEFGERFGKPEYIRYATHAQAGPQAGESVVFDFWVDQDPERIQYYAEEADKTIFLNVPKYSLADLVHQLGMPEATLVGFNGLPTFINRELLELSLLRSSDEKVVKEVCATLGAEYRLVQDRVGMVTPRIICQIINEAYYTVQEGTAQPADIDLGMKLGTNYPQGPFEWCRRLGVSNVYELLEALWHDTHDERYKICPLLKQEYMRTEAGLA